MRAFLFALVVLLIIVFGMNHQIRELVAQDFSSINWEYEVNRWVYGKNAP